MNVVALKSRFITLINKYGKDILLSATNTIPGYTESFDTVQGKKYWVNNTTKIRTDTQPTVTPETIRVAEKAYKIDEIDGSTILTGDRRFVIPSTVTFDSKSVLIVEGKRYNILPPIKIYEIAGDVMAYEVHCRG